MQLRSTLDSAKIAELVTRAQGGDREAFEAIYHLYRRQMLDLAHRIVKSFEDAEEIVQESFFQALRNIQGFEGKSSIYTWLYRIVVNISFQHNKTRTRRSRFMHPLNETLGVVSVANPEREAERRLVFEAVRKEIDLLPPSQRELIILGPIQGFSYEQISQAFGVSQNVIKGRLHRARASLRRSLDGKYPNVISNLFSTHQIKKIEVA